MAPEEVQVPETSGDANQIAPATGNTNIVRVRSSARIGAWRSQAKYTQLDIDDDGPPPTPTVIIGGGAQLKEDLTNLVDNSNVDFPTLHTFVVHSTQLYLNGMLQAEGGDYDEVAPQSVQMYSPPLIGDALIIVYTKEA